MHRCCCDPAGESVTVKEKKAMFRYLHYLTAFNCVLLGIEFFYCFMKLPRRPRFVLRVLLTVPVYAVLFNTLLLNELMEFNWLFALFCLTIFGASVLLLHFWFDATYLSVLFYASAGYAVENIVHFIRRAELYFSVTAVPESLLVPGKWALSLAVVFLAYGLFIRNYPYGGNVGVDRRFVVFFVLLTLTVTNLMNSWMKIAYTRNLVYAVYAIICDILLLMVQFGVFQRTRLQFENDTIRTLMASQAKQQLIRQESMDIINIKCHDLKHQIAALKTVKDQTERDREIEELEKAASFYDSTIKTGCSTLDTLLTDRKLVCNGRQIEFTCLADARGLEKISTVDLFTLFGNAMDNAIEAVSGLENTQNRLISLKVERQGDMTRICLENYVEKVPQIRDGLPVSTKENSLYHGFGCKSIRMIAQKYGGTMRIVAEGNSFRLFLLFPF